MLCIGCRSELAGYTAPFFGGAVDDGLGEGPAVSGQVDGDVLAFAVGEIGGGLEDLGSVPCSVVVMGIGVIYTDHDVVVWSGGRVVRGQDGLANDHRSVAYVELGAVAWDHQAEGESEGGW